MEIVGGVSAEQQERRHLMQAETVHGLIQVAIASCGSERKTSGPQEPSVGTEDDKFYAKEAVRILHNLANFDRPKCYIPGETVRQKRDAGRYMQWGGLISLYYVRAHAKVPEIREFCDNSKVRDLDIKDLEAMIETLKQVLESTVKPPEAVPTPEPSTSEDQKGANDTTNPASARMAGGAETAASHEVGFPEFVQDVSV